MRQITKPRRLCSSSTQTRVAKIVHHNMGCGGISIRPAPVPQPQQGSRERSGSCTTQEPCPPQSPRLFGPSPQDYGLTPRSDFCQKGQELSGLLRPPAANLPHQPSSGPGDAPNRHNAKETPPVGPPNKGSPSAKISIRLLSSGSGSAKSKSRNMAFVTTLPPASLQMRAPALSTANPRRPKNPALAHAARWWPKMLRGWPHRH